MSQVAQPKRGARNAGFKKYPGYRDAEAQWTGRVPENWELRKLKYAAEFTPERASEASADLPYVSLEHIESETGKLLELDEETTPDSTVHRFRFGDVLFGKLRPYLAKVWEARQEGDCTSELVVLRPREEVSSSFLGFQLLAPPFIDAVDAQTYGAKMPRVSPQQFGDMYVAVPSQEEQESIVQFLNIQTSQIDRLIEKKERLIDLLEERRTALITKAVTKGLDSDVPMKDSGVEWLGEIPEHWEQTKLRHLASVQRGASPRPIDDQKYFDPDGQYGWVRIRDVTDSNMYLRETEQTLSELGKSKSVPLKPGRVILSIAATVGKPIITDTHCCIHDGFVYFQQLSLEPEFLYFIFHCQGIYSGLGKLGTQLNLNTDTVGDIAVPVPPKSEQKRISAYLRRQVRHHEKMEAKLREAISTLHEYRSALITAAVTGKIDVRDRAA